eukprot:4357041-Amphidinium_carterae.1
MHGLVSPVQNELQVQAMHPRVGNNEGIPTPASKVAYPAAKILWQYPPKSKMHKPITIGNLLAAQSQHGSGGGLN